MSFQAYLDTIRAKTGQTPADLRRYAEWEGYVEHGKLKPGVTAGMVVAHLKRDFDLGRGHALAVFALLQGLRREGD